MRRIVLAATIGTLIPALVGFTWPGTLEWLCTRGIKQYQDGGFSAAEESFERALEHSPLSGRLQFNRGTALYRQERFEEAAEAFTLAGKSGEHELARDAAYNLGNTHFGAGELGPAIEAYKNALRLDPDDGEAKYNLELALRKQQEQQRQNQQQEQQDEKQEDQESQSEEEQQQDDRREEDQPRQQQDGQQDREQADRLEERQREDELSEAQARRLLHALASQDAEMQKLIRRAPQRRQPSEGEKDW